MDAQLICIIEDNTSIRKLFATLLKKSGYEIVDFGDGESALNWLNDNTPDCLIIDILLPDRNGTELVKIIRNLPNGDKLPLIAVTGFAHSQDKDKFINSGFDHYISKPVDTKSFVKEVESVIVDKKNN